MRKFLLRTLWILGGTLVLLAVLGTILALTPASTPPIAGERSVVSLETIRLGGVDQFVLIRGVDRTAPVLLFVHAGPELVSMPLSSVFSRELEKNFVVVQWDPRGTGNSCTPEATASGISLEKIAGDTIELAEAMRTRFGRPKVFLAGFGIGSVVGANVAARRPDLLYAYVGLGQTVNGLRNEQDSLEYVRAEAERAKDSESLRTLADFTVPYEDQSQLMTERHVVEKYGGDFATDVKFGHFLPVALRAPEHAPSERFHYGFCFFPSADALWKDYWQIDLFKSAPRIDVPVFFFHGRADHVASPRLLEEYAAHVTTPPAEIVWFENSAYYVPLEEPDRFQSELIARLLPLAVKAPS